jgi:hypothetical protein
MSGVHILSLFPHIFRLPFSDLGFILVGSYYVVLDGHYLSFKLLAFICTISAGHVIMEEPRELEGNPASDSSLHLPR